MHFAKSILITLSLALAASATAQFGHSAETREPAHSVVGNLINSSGKKRPIDPYTKPAIFRLPNGNVEISGVVASDLTIDSVGRPKHLAFFQASDDSDLENAPEIEIKVSRAVTERKDAKVVGFSRWTAIIPAKNFKCGDSIAVITFKDLVVEWGRPHIGIPRRGSERFETRQIMIPYTGMDWGYSDDSSRILDVAYELRIAQAARSGSFRTDWDDWDTQHLRAAVNLNAQQLSAFIASMMPAPASQEGQGKNGTAQTGNATASQTTTTTVVVGAGGSATQESVVKAEKPYEAKFDPKKRRLTITAKRGCSIVIGTNDPDLKDAKGRTEWSLESSNDPAVDCKTFSFDFPSQDVVDLSKLVVQVRDARTGARAEITFNRRGEK